MQHFRPVIASTIVKALGCAYSQQLIDDLIQETYFKLIRNRSLSSFRSADANAIYGLLRKAAYSVAKDEFRRSSAGKRGGMAGIVSLDTANPAHNAETNSNLDRSIFVKQIEKLVATIAPKERDQLIFKLHYRYQLTSKEIASIPMIGLSQKGVESLLVRLINELRNCLSLAGQNGWNPS